jgi:non-heme chloroperoxidase
MAIQKHVAIAQGISLHYWEAGSGQPLIMIPGWSQSAAGFKRSIDVLAKSRLVIALDMRGHGESDKPAGGYRISRLAKDLHEVIGALGLSSVDLLGHSMGSSIIWGYLDLFGTEKLRKLVIVDQAPMTTILPAFDDTTKSECGCLFASVAEAAGFCDIVRATDTVDGHAGLIKGMFTSAMPESELQWIAAENLKLPRAHAADLLFDHILNDWRDVIRNVRLPSLVIGGETSIFSARSQNWIAEQNPNAKASIFPTSEGGGHFMFFENAQRFNDEVAGFLG